MITKYITFTDKNGVSKSIATVVKGRNENKSPIVYPKGLLSEDFVNYWLAINDKMGRVGIRSGYRLNEV